MTPRDVEVRCKDCNRPFFYSARSRQRGGMVGESPPERCADCRQSHNRQTIRMGAAYVDLRPQRPLPAAGLKPGRLGSLAHPARIHEDVLSPAPEIDREQFGIKDEKLVPYLRSLEHHQVSVVKAPTGSGKSTYFIYRLMMAPEPLPEDFLTRYGRILVTQPRIEATSSIPQFVAESLHGSRSGPGLDIGYHHSEARQSDRHNLLEYVTDGSLLNLIMRGGLDDVSTIVIDEAHERSLNIDLIIALMRRELRSYPHLKLIIVSATIEPAFFQEYFEPDFSVLVEVFPGKTQHPVLERFASPAMEIPTTEWAARMPNEIARMAYGVLRWMECGDLPHGVEEDADPCTGDLLCFLPGKRTITAAIKDLDDLIQDDPDLQGKVDLFPLYADLKPASRKAALKGKAGPGRYRVVVATNLAETSLTVEGIRHVIDSGLINQTEWDPSTLSTLVRPRPHSKSGLRQRRGRAGRVASGVWHCRFTQAQFDALEEATPPEVSRAPLGAVVLRARSAGVPDPGMLRWLAPGPPVEELRRANQALADAGVTDQDGDLTALGWEVSSMRADVDDATLLLRADQAGCVLEVATLLAVAASGGLKALHDWDSRWSAQAKWQVDAIHRCVRGNSVDDAEAALAICAGWAAAGPGRTAWARERFLSASTLAKVLLARDQLLQPLKAKTRTDDVRNLDARLLDRARAVMAWTMPDSLYERATDEDARYVPLMISRTNRTVVESLHQRAEIQVDPMSVCAKTMPRRIAALRRRRNRLWATPLEAAREVVEASLCISLDELDIETMAATFLGLLANMPGKSDRSWWLPDILPGYRYQATAAPRPGAVELFARLPTTPVPVVAVEDEPDEVEDFERGDLGERGQLHADDGDPEVSASDWDSEDDLPSEHASDLESTDHRTSATQSHSTVTAKCMVDKLPEGRFRAVVTEHTPESGLVVGIQREEVLSQLRESLAGADEALLTVEALIKPQWDRWPFVLLREPTTGTVIPAGADAFGVGVRGRQLESLAIGDTGNFHVDWIAEATGTARLSRIPDAIEKVGKITSSGRAVRGLIVDADDQRVYIAMGQTASDPRLSLESPALVFDVRVTDLPRRPSEMRVGQEVSVRPKRRAFKPQTFDLKRKVTVLDPLPDGIFLAKTSLRADVPVDVTIWLELLSHAQSMSEADCQEVWLRAAAALALRSCRPYVNVIDVTGIASAAESGMVECSVSDITPRGAAVSLESGYSVFIPGDQLSWPGQSSPELEPGQPLSAWVGRADVTEGELWLSLRDPKANPYRGLGAGQITRAQVVEIRGGGVALQVESGALGYLPGSLAASRDLTAEFAPGATTTVRIQEVDADACSMTLSRWLVDEQIEVTSDRASLLQTLNPRAAIGAFRSLAGESVRITLNDGVVSASATDLTQGKRAVEQIRKCLSGPFAVLDLPDKGPWIGAAKDFALLDALRKNVPAAINMIDLDGRGALAVAASSTSDVTAVVAFAAKVHRTVTVRLDRFIPTELLQQHRALALRGRLIILRGGRGLATIDGTSEGIAATLQWLRTIGVGVGVGQEQSQQLVPRFVVAAAAPIPIRSVPKVEPTPAPKSSPAAPQTVTRKVSLTRRQQQSLIDPPRRFLVFRGTAPLDEIVAGTGVKHSWDGLDLVVTGASASVDAVVNELRLAVR